jgi:hypothetical protein
MGVCTQKRRSAVDKKKQEIPDSFLIVVVVIALAPWVFRVIGFVVSGIVTGVTSFGNFMEWIFPYLVLAGALAFIVGISIALVALHEWYKQKVEEIWKKKLLESENSWKEKLDCAFEKMREKENQIERLRREIGVTKHLLEKKTYEQNRSAQDAVNDSFKSFL